MIHLLKKIIIFSTALCFFSGCLTFVDKSNISNAPQDMTKFSENHISKDKNVYLDVNMNCFSNGDKNPCPGEEKSTETTRKNLEKINFAKFLDKKEDANFILTINSTVKARVNIFLLFISSFTLLIPPVKYSADATTQAIIYNKSKNIKKEFSFFTTGSMWVDLLFLPVMPFYNGDREIIQNEYDNFFYRIGNDDIWL